MKDFFVVYSYKLVMGIVIISLTSSLCAQARYKHVPRVKVDKKCIEKVAFSQVKTANATTTEFIMIEENPPVTTENVAYTENTTTVSVDKDVVIVFPKTNLVVKPGKKVNAKKEADINPFTNKVKKESKLMEVKEVKKTTALELWWIIFIICLALGIIFLVISLVMLFTAGYSALSLYYIFVVIAVVLLLAANILLPLGLKGKLTKKTD